MEVKTFEFNSLYNIHLDQSFVGEQFYSISLRWQCGIEALKIRIADWTPKRSRENSAVIYYEVKTIEKAKEILRSYKSFDFKTLQLLYEKMFLEAGHMNTGETRKFEQEVFMPVARKLIDIL